MVFAGGFCISDVRHLFGDPIEVIKCQRNASLISDCQQMQHRIGAATEGVYHCDCVLKCFFGHDVTRIDAETQQIDHGFASPTRIDITTRVDCRRRRCAGQAHAECFSNARHGISGEHATTGAFTWARGTLDVVDFFAGHCAGSACTNCFKHGGDIDVLAFVHAGQC